jgi:hypothetical protein
MLSPLLFCLLQPGRISVAPLFAAATLLFPLLLFPLLSLPT